MTPQKLFFITLRIGLLAAGVLTIAVRIALAQQPDPAQNFAKEWGTLQAADTLAASSHGHVAELAQKLIADYQRQREESAKAKSDLAAAESRLQWTLDNWVPKTKPE